jgi:hypothetical protein
MKNPKIMRLAATLTAMVLLLSMTACAKTTTAASASTSASTNTAAATDGTTAQVSRASGQPGTPPDGTPPNGTPPGGVGSATVVTGTGAKTLADKEALSGGTYTSVKADENAVRAEGSITASLSNATITKLAGAASSSDASSFYGLNAAVLALDGATLNITGGTVTAAAEGANGVFAYNKATVNIKNTTINVSGGNAGGIEVAGGGILNASNLTVTAASKAAIRSDRGGGTLVADGGTYTTTGSSGAPAIYSTADITVKDATLTAQKSEAVVVEGLNSVTLENCTVTGNMTGMTGSSTENLHNVMLYQSMSGDAQVGNSSFTMTGGSLTAKAGDMFYVTNTECVISLNDTALNLSDTGSLLQVTGNDGSRGWGTAGANGGKCTVNAAGQKLSGSITVDSISTLALNLIAKSTFTGAINTSGTAAKSLTVTLDSTSTWTLTADSYVTTLNGSMSNVSLNGHTLFVNGVATK